MRWIGIGYLRADQFLHHITVVINASQDIRVNTSLRLKGGLILIENLPVLTEQAQQVS